MSEHNWGKVYKSEFMHIDTLNSNDTYRQCYNCELIEILGYNGWRISAYSIFFLLSEDKTTSPSCNELKMHGALE